MFINAAATGFLKTAGFRPELEPESNSGTVTVVAVCRSFGCTVVEMVTGHPPWHEFEGVAAIFKIATEHPPVYRLPDDTSDVLRQFLMACFTLSVDDRPTSEDLLRHSLFGN